MCFLSDHLPSSLRPHHCTIVLLFTGFYWSQVIFFTSRLLALNFKNRLQGVGCFDWPTQRMLVSLGQTYWKSCRILLLPLMCSTESSGKQSGMRYLDKISFLQDALSCTCLEKYWILKGLFHCLQPCPSGFLHHMVFSACWPLDLSLHCIL